GGLAAVPLGAREEGDPPAVLLGKIFLVAAVRKIHDVTVAVHDVHAVAHDALLPGTPSIYSNAALFLETRPGAGCPGSCQGRGQKCLITLRPSATFEISPRIFAPVARHRPCLFGHGSSIPHPDRDETPLVPGSIGRIPPGECLALAPSLPGRAHLLPRRGHRPGRAVSRKALGAF